MKTTGKCILSFVAGLGIGGMIGYKVYEIRLNKILMSDLDDETYIVTAPAEEAEVNPEPKEAPVEDAITEPYPEKPDLAEYSAKIMEERYATASTPPIKKGKASSKKELYPIEYEEFGEKEYDCVYYTVYTDDIIADENGDKITTFKKILGKKLYDEVMSSEYDSMFIRDERRKVDYQIVKDPRSYYSIFPDSNETTLE